MNASMQTDGHNGLSAKDAPKLIALYARVSTARQEEDGTIETQLVVLRDYARQHGHSIVKEYVDDGWSGDLLARPALDALRQDVTSRLWQAVLIYDPDRLARRYSYQELVTDELREAGTEVMFVTVPAPKNSEEKILHGVRGLFAEYERAKIAERFRLGKLRKVKEGHVLTSEAPYGYTYIRKQGNQSGCYQVNDGEAHVVRMIFQWVADEGLTIRQIVRRLQKLGIAPRESHRGTWNLSTLSRLLRNTAYIGQAVWNSSYAVAPEKPRKKEKYRKIKKSSRRARPRDQWLTVAVPAIVEEGTFDRARARLAANYAMSKRNRVNQYLLAGKIRCACGRARIGEGPKNGKYLYYRCSDRVASFPMPPTCKQRAVNARIADQLVWDELTNLMSSPELLIKQLDRWHLARRSSTSEQIDEIVKVRENLVKLKAQVSRYDRAYGAGLFTLEQLKEYTEPIRARIVALEQRSAEATNQARQPVALAVPGREQIGHFAEQARKTLVSLHFEQRRAIVLNIVDKIITTPQKLSVYGYIPIDDDVEVRSVNRYRQNADRLSRPSRIPFEFVLDLPAPLIRGVDYGFGKRHGSQASLQ